MKVEVAEHKRYSIVSLAGDVDMQYSPLAREQILMQLNKQHHLLVDLSAVDYIDSSGVATLVEGFQLARNNDLDFGLVGVSDKAMQVLQLARLDKVFVIHSAATEFSFASE